MAKICSICKKSPIIAGKRKLLRGKYNPVGKRKVYPNLQWIKLENNKRVKACTQCIKTIFSKAAKTTKSTRG